MSAIYLDHAASSPLAGGVLEAMLPFLTTAQGNPSSVHEHGRSARNAVDAARDSLATVLRCEQREIVFTGSGTEADNLALRGVLERWGDIRGRHVVVSAIEHDAVLETARRLEERGAATVTVVPCAPSGQVSPGDVAAAVREDTVAVSVMFVNNETGIVQDVRAVAAAVHARKPETLVHTDAVQALARLDVVPHELGVDLASFSAHKVGGPKGTGALWVRHGVSIAAQSTGGGHERARRSGTENVAGIVGFAAAAKRVASRRAQEAGRQRDLAQRLIDGVCAAVPDAMVAGDRALRAPGIVMFVIPGVRTDVLLTALDRLGVSASGGSACSSGAPTPSHVLLAMGYPPALAAGALRLSLGEATGAAEVERAIAAIGTAVTRARTAELTTA